jgi:hypothetical protein
VLVTIALAMEARERRRFPSEPSRTRSGTRRFPREPAGMNRYFCPRKLASGVDRRSSSC